MTAPQKTLESPGGFAGQSLGAARGSAALAKCENCGTEYPSRAQANACCWADKETDLAMERLKSERDAAWGALQEIVRFGSNPTRKNMMGGISRAMLEVAETALRAVPPNAQAEPLPPDGDCGH